MDAYRYPLLRISPTAQTAAAVALLRAARTQLPCRGSICAGLDRADPDGRVRREVYAEAVAALDVAARVFGIGAATGVGAHQPDAAYVFDIALYHLTGAAPDIAAALTAFRRAAGPILGSPA